jgi:hypothetical protein
MGAAEVDFESRRRRAKQVNDEALEFGIRSEPPKPETVGDFVFA